MNLRQNCCVVVVVFSITGCASPKIPEFVEAPEPPEEWSVSVNNRVGCPIVTGEFELLPEVAEFQKNGLWHVSNGNWYDYLLLMPFDQVASDIRTPYEATSSYSQFSLFMESDDQGKMLRITSPDRRSENFVTHVFSQDDNDYACQDGNMVFPEFLIQGGTEGSYLSGRIHRQATITSLGNLLFYEQIQSHENVHKYYLFKIKGS